MRKIVKVFGLLAVGFCVSGSYLVQQTDYNCIPASIEMVYRLFGDYGTSQQTIRNEMDTKYGILPVDEMEAYLDDHFEYKTKRICCEDSLINAIGEDPVLLVLDMQKLNMSRDYQGHCLVGVDLKENENGYYVKTLDPDGQIERWYPLDDLMEALEDWNDKLYIMEAIK